MDEPPLLCWAPGKGIFPKAQPTFPGCTSSCFPCHLAPLGRVWLHHTWSSPTSGCGLLLDPLSLLSCPLTQPSPSSSPGTPQPPNPEHTSWTMSPSYTSLWRQHSQSGATNTSDFPGGTDPTLTQPSEVMLGGFKLIWVQTDLGSNWSGFKLIWVQTRHVQPVHS